MNSDSSTSPSPLTGFGTARGRRLSEALLAAAHLPLVIDYFVRLWTLPHYQFFPLVLVGACLLLRRENRETSDSTSTPGVAGGWCVGLFLLTAAVLLGSPWLAATAAAINFTTWQAARCGSWRSVLPAAALLAVVLRPPLGIDTWLIQSLQRITAIAADVTLDVLGVLHTLSGNVIELPGRSLLVEEACSGVNSFFSATAATLFYLLWNRRGWISSVLLFLSIPVWVVFANVVRVVGVAVLCHRWEIDADRGLLHEILGLATFALAVALIVSTERFLRFYARVVERPTPPEATSTVPVQASNVPPTFGRRRSIVGTAAAVLCLVQMPVLATRFERLAKDGKIGMDLQLGESWPAETVTAWRRTDYETIERDFNSPFGRFSEVWTLAQAGRQATFSFDYPFVGWHELTDCYEAQGWHIEARRVLNEAPATTPVVEVVLRHESAGRYGRLYFNLLTSDGNVLPVRKRRYGEVEEWLDGAANRLRGLAAGSLPFAVPPTEELTYQFQLFMTDYMPPSDEECVRWLTIFREREAQLSEHFRRASAAASDAGDAAP